MFKGTLFRKSNARKIISIFALLGLLQAQTGFAEEFTQDEVDIDEAWQGTAVSVKFSDDDAVQDYDGEIDSYSGNLTFGMMNTVWASGSVAASVLGDGSGVVQTSAEIEYHGMGGTNIGTSSQSLKPFVPSGSGTVDTSITIDFDGLLVVKEDSVDADDYTQARVDFFAAIEQFDSDEGIRQTLGTNEFEGMAYIEQTGGGAVTVNVPETFNTVDFPDEFSDNTWHDNDNLTITQVVAAGAGANQMNVADLPMDTQADATTHLAAGRTVYYLLYSQTFDFQAEGGQTYFVYMDLNTSTTATDGNFSVTTYAASDFSNTINFTLGGADFTTLVNIEGDQDIDGNDQFGGTSSLVTLDDADLEFTANADLNESFVLADGTNNTFNTAGFDGSVDGVISGDGALIKAGGGTLTLNGENTYTGGTGITGGTLALGASNVLHARGAVSVSGGATFDLDGNDQTIGALSGAGAVELGIGHLSVGNDDGSSSFSGAIGGTGDVTKLGSGTLILAGNNTTTGDLTVQEGLARINGTWSGDANVGADGALGGTGTINGDVIVSGVAKPGASIGTLAVVGNYTQAAGSSIEVEFNNTAGAGNADLIDVTGAASIGDNTTVIPVAVERITNNVTHTFLQTTGGITGAFTDIEDNYALLDFALALANANNDYQLSITRVGYATVANTQNRRELSRILDIHDAAGASGDLATVLSGLDLLSVSEIQSGYDDLSPSISPNAGLVARANQRLMHHDIADRFAFSRLSREQGSDGGDTPWSVYARGIGNVGSYENDGEAAGIEWQSAGLGVGVDRRLGQDSLAGIYVGGINSAIDGRDTTGSVDINGVRTAAYIGHNTPNYFLEGVIGYGHDENDTERSIGYLARRADGDFSRDLVSALIGAGWRMQAVGFDIEPFVYADYIYLKDDGYHETGAGSANVHVTSADTESLRHELGVRFYKGSTIKSWNTITRLEASWAHEYLERNFVKIASLSGESFNVSSVAPARDTFKAGISSQLQFNDALSFWVSYNTQVNKDLDDHVFRLGLNWKF